MNKYDKGFIYLYRQFKNWRYYKNDNIKSVFIHCLLSAYWKDEIITEYKGKSIDPPIVIPKGSFITSRRKMAKDLDKTESEIRYALKKLSTPDEQPTVATNHCTQEIELTTTQSYTIVNICNFDMFQPLKDVLQPTKCEDFYPHNNPQLQPQLNNINTKEDKKIKRYKDKSASAQSLNHNSLTLKLLNNGVIDEDDIPEVFDELFDNVSSEYSLEHINVVTDYIAKKMINKNINNKFFYFKKSLLINLEKMNNLMNDDKKQTDEDEPIIECDEDKLMDLLNKLEKGELT
ncbi:hypothetical protein [Longibaculum muris]|uniref:hypothetical protein n=1 Tax=Longibaculum muris TaxID=1796628 RepID=UPI0022E6A5C2|nr:hypothetical protein [Longibaculum muris]